MRNMGHETGMKPGMKPVWNRYETGYETSMKPVWNRYETGYETRMKPVWNRRITQTICFLVATAYKAMAAAFDGNGATRYEAEYELEWNQYETAAPPTLFVSLSSQPIKPW